jgi:hypothetical protein
MVWWAGTRADRHSVAPQQDMGWEIVASVAVVAVVGFVLWGVRDRADRVRRAAEVGAVIEMAPPLRRSRGTGVVLVLWALGLLATLVLAERSRPPEPPVGPAPSPTTRTG